MRGFSLRLKFLFLACLSLFVIGLSGCVGGHRADVFKSKTVLPPTRGAKLTEGAWEKLETAEPKGQIGSSKTVVWILPFNIWVTEFLVAKDRETALGKSVAWNDISTPLLLTTLPFHFGYNEYGYKKGTLESVSKSGFNWWLLWASAHHTGEPSNYNFKAKGIPLFYAFVSVKGEKAPLNVSFNNVLWTLGPAWLKVDIHTSTQNQKGYYFAPLLLGGVLGGILWTDHYTTITSTESSLGHGPLFGYMGYYKQHARWLVYPKPKDKDDRPAPEVHGSQTMSGAMLGILWSQYTRRDNEGKVDKSRYGPLWTMFGYSQRHGKGAVKFFWIPIRF